MKINLKNIIKQILKEQSLIGEHEIIGQGKNKRILCDCNSEGYGPTHSSPGCGNHILDHVSLGCQWHQSCCKMRCEIAYSDRDWETIT